MTAIATATANATTTTTNTTTRFPVAHYVGNTNQYWATFDDDADVDDKPSFVLIVVVAFAVASAVMFHTLLRCIMRHHA